MMGAELVLAALVDVEASAMAITYQDFSVL